MRGLLPLPLLPHAAHLAQRDQQLCVRAPAPRQRPLCARLRAAPARHGRRGARRRRRGARRRCRRHRVADWLAPRALR